MGKIITNYWQKAISFLNLVFLLSFFAAFIIGMIRPSWIVWWKEPDRFIVGVFLFVVLSMWLTGYGLVLRSLNLDGHHKTKRRNKIFHEPIPSHNTEPVAPKIEEKRKEIKSIYFSLNHLIDSAQSGDTKAVELLANELQENEDKHKLIKIAKSLDSTNWTPNQDVAGAMFWAVKCEWDKCLEVGDQAIKSLLLFRPKNSKLKEVCKSLEASGSPKIKEALRVYLEYLYRKRLELEMKIAEHNRISSTFPDNYPRDQMQGAIDNRLTPHIQWAEMKMRVIKSKS